MGDTRRVAVNTESVPSRGSDGPGTESAPQRALLVVVVRDYSSANCSRLQVITVSRIGLDLR